MKRSRSSGDLFSLAFLDIITCGFGAVILLLIISKPVMRDASEAAAVPTREPEIARAAERVAGLRARWEALQTSEAERAATMPDEDPSLEEAVRVAGQRLTELRRDNRGLERVKESLERATLRVRAPVTRRDPEVGGIPVDSEYVIFIIDTSGSMKAIWPRIMETMNNVLDIHPTVRGFQVMNDNGDYLIKAYRKKWIPDTPQRRKSILNVVRNWNAFSNSSPVEGLQTALRAYARQKEKVAIYIFGDDYSGNTYDQVLDTLRQLNTDRLTQKRKVRVHAVGFISEHGSVRYATLMREVTQTNNGAFLAMPVRDARGGTGVSRPNYESGPPRQ